MAYRRAAYASTSLNGGILSRGAPPVASGVSLSAGAGSLVITGMAATLRAGRRLVAQAGAFAISGNPATLRADRRLAAGVGSFVIVGQDVTLTKGGGISYELYDEAGSAAITSVPGLRVSLDSGASWQTLGAAGLSIAVVSGELVVSGLTGAEGAGAVRFHFEQQQLGEPYSAVDTVAAADTTGTSISGLYARHASDPDPALTTSGFLPGLPIFPTPASIPLVAA